MCCGKSTTQSNKPSIPKSVDITSPPQKQVITASKNDIGKIDPEIKKQLIRNAQLANIKPPNK